MTNLTESLKYELRSRADERTREQYIHDLAQWQEDLAYRVERLRDAVLNEDGGPDYVAQEEQYLAECVAARPVLGTRYTHNGCPWRPRPLSVLVHKERHVKRRQTHRKHQA